jgi:GntR family transcriptional regulator/MocR family aminotransferase
MRAFGTDHLHYGDPRGSLELRTAIADHLLSARGLRCDPDQIMLTSGTQHALRIVLSAILKPGDRVWCEDPGYPAAQNAIEHCGYRPVPVPVDEFGMVVAKGRTRAPSARAAYVTPSHQFPLGVQMSMPRRLELLDWAGDADAFVFEDDYDSEFRYDGAPLLSLAGIDHLRRVIYIGTFAKTLFPGLRIGYCALPERLIGPVTTARAALDRFPGTLLEGAVADMLNSAPSPPICAGCAGSIARPATRWQEHCRRHRKAVSPCRCRRRVCIWSRGSIRRPSRLWRHRRRPLPASKAGCWRKPIVAPVRFPALCWALPVTRFRN